MIETALRPEGKILLVLVLGLGIVIFAYRVLRIVRLLRAGRADNRLDHFWTRFSYAILYIFVQSRVFRNRVAGAAHIAIFYGFLVISIETIHMLWGALLGQPFLPFITESSIFLWATDILAVLVIVGVLVSAYRRYVVHPPEVHNSVSAAAVLTTILVLMLSLLTAEAAKHILTPTPNAPPIALLFSVGPAGLTEAQLSSVHTGAWWVHILLVVGFLVYIPHSKHMHLLVCPFNEFLRSLRPKGELSTADVDSPSFLGAGRFDQLSWKQLTDLFACTECGRCQQYCPAHLSGTPLAPRQMILDMRDALLGKTVDREGHKRKQATGTHGAANGTAVVDAIGRDSVWSCTTCRACQEQCPVFIEHIDKIVEARRFLLDSEGASPTLAKALEGLSRVGNPQAQAPSDRTVFLDKLRVPIAVEGSAPDYVLWIGCSAAYTPEAQEAMSSLVKIMKTAGVGMAILGAVEQCCGDPARRVGEEGLFQDLARHNIEEMNRLGVKKVVTNCPHCFNTLNNEYPRFGAQFAVVHHVELIAELISRKRIQLSRPFDKAITYHDPCYLGRYNDIYDAPREILRQATTGGIREMGRIRERAVCCGGGGGQMFLESTAGTRVNRLRFSEVEDLGVPLLATACPFCKTMMNDAAQYNASGPRVRVKDIAEVVCEAMLV